MKWIGHDRSDKKAVKLEKYVDNERSSKRCQTAPAAQTVRPAVKKAFALATFAIFCTSDHNTSYILITDTFFEMNWTRSWPPSEWRLSPLLGHYILTTHVNINIPLVFFIHSPSPQLPVVFQAASPRITATWGYWCSIPTSSGRSGATDGPRCGTKRSGRWMLV